MVSAKTFTATCSGIALALVTLGCEQGSPGVESSKPPAATPAPLVWSEGKAQTYHVQLDTEIRSSMSPLPQQMQIRAKLVLRSEGQAPTQRLLGRLSDVEVLDHRGKVLDEARVLAEDLSLPFGMEMSGGVATKFVHDARATENAYGLTTHVLSALELTGDKLVHAGPEQEWDATGLATVDYEAAGPNKFSWKKTAYERVVASQSGSHSSARRKVAPEIRKATGTLELDSSGLRKLARSEETSVKVADSASIGTKVALTLVRLDSAPAAADALPAWTALNGTGRVTEVGQSFAWDGTSRIDDLKRGDFTLDGIFEVLATPVPAGATGDTSPGERRGAAARALAAFLRDDPKTIERVIAELGKNTPAEPQIFAALGLASTPASLEVLARAASSERLSLARRGDAASAMLRAQWPTQAAFETLEKLVAVPSLREHGLMGIGTFVRRFRDMRQRDPMRKGIEVLRSELGRSTSAKQLVPVLLGIANSGASELYDAVLPYQESDKKDVRDAAIQAVRLMGDARVDERLVLLLSKPHAEDVRSGLHALRPRPSPPAAVVDQVKALARAHPEPDVRREAVLVLEAWANERDELRQYLASLRATEKNDQVLRALN